jgi:hypothetical protein
LPPVGLIRLVGMLCLEQNDKRLVGRRYLSADTTIDREEVRELTPAERLSDIPRSRLIRAGGAPRTGRSVRPADWSVLAVGERVLPLALGQVAACGQAGVALPRGG